MPRKGNYSHPRGSVDSYLHVGRPFSFCSKHLTAMTALLGLLNRVSRLDEKSYNKRLIKFYQNFIEENNTDQRELLAAAKTLLNRGD